MQAHQWRRICSRDLTEKSRLILPFVIIHEQPNSPCTAGFDIALLGKRFQLFTAEILRCVEDLHRPQRAAAVIEHSLEFFDGVGIELAHGASFLQQTSCVPHHPFVFVHLQLRQLQIIQLRQVALPGFHIAVGDFEYPPIRAIDDLVVVAFAGIGPVADVDAAVGAVCQRDAAEPRIVGEHEVPGVACHIGRTVALQNIMVDAAAVEVAHEDAVAVAAVDDDVPPDLEQVGHAAVVEDRDARRRRMVDVLEPEAKPTLLRVALRLADDLADELDVAGVPGDRARLEVGDAVSGERRVDDEDGECGRHRQGDHEPRRTGSHAGIVALAPRQERR